MSISDISPVRGLKPKKKYFEEVGDDCINLDGCIALMQSIDTPQAKAVNAAFRKQLAYFRITMHGAPQEKIREEAFLAALGDCGVRTTFIPLKGTLD